MKRHVENIRKFGIPVKATPSINEFAISDTEAKSVYNLKLIDVPVELASVWADGAEGGVGLG